MQINRTHDTFYAQESHKHNTKESFKYIAKKARESLERYAIFGGGGGKILDIGCSNGDFLFYLSEIFPNAELSGVDILPTLLEKTKTDFLALQRPCPTLYLGDIVSGEGLPKMKFDMVFFNGVVGIFDDLQKPLEHFCSLIAPNGVGYIWGVFNPFPLDVFVKSRAVGATHLESGWNIHSQASLRIMLKNLGYNAVFYDDFEIGIDLPQSDDYLRTWTFKLENGKRAIINGLGIIHSFVLVEVRSDCT